MTKSTDASPRRHTRANDKLCPFEEISERTLMTPATIRYKRHKGELPFVFRMGRRLVAWESDMLDWIEAQAAQDQAKAS